MEFLGDSILGSVVCSYLYVKDFIKYMNKMKDF